MLPLLLSVLAVGSRLLPESIDDRADVESSWPDKDDSAVLRVTLVW